MSTVWRPQEVVRPLAIGLIRRDGALLVMSVRDDTGSIKGWRPLGGGIEFGERAAEALRREFMEELGESITEPRLVTVLENLYEHYETRGHEIVFVFDTAFANAQTYRSESFSFRDGGTESMAVWVELARFRSGDERLFPAGLSDVL